MKWIETRGAKRLGKTWYMIQKPDDGTITFVGVAGHNPSWQAQRVIDRLQASGWKILRDESETRPGPVIGHGSHIYDTQQRQIVMIHSGVRE